MIGEVKFFNTLKSYGFIVCDDGGRDVHIRGCDLGGDVLPSAGDRVSFDVVEHPDGRRSAMNLRMLESAARTDGEKLFESLERTERN